MISRMRITAVLGAVVLLASACDSGDTPFSPSARPALNGGGHVPGGNVTGTPGDSTTYTTNATSTAVPVPVEEPAPTQGGGHVPGGN